jgi:hypothetical protein
MTSPLACGALLDRPPGSGDPDQADQRRVARRVAGGEGHSPSLGCGPPAATWPCRAWPGGRLEGRVQWYRRRPLAAGVRRPGHAPAMGWAGSGLVRRPTCPGDPGRRAPRRVVGPCLGQVQLPVDQRPPPWGWRRPEHAELAVVDLAGGARVLALHSHRGGALLEEPGLIHHQHRARVAQVLHGLGAQVVADQLRGPGRRWPAAAASRRGSSRRRVRSAASRLVGWAQEPVVCSRGVPGCRQVARALPVPLR